MTQLEHSGYDPCAINIAINQTLCLNKQHNLQEHLSCFPGTHRAGTLRPAPAVGVCFLSVDSN